MAHRPRRKDFLVTFDLKTYYYHIEIDLMYHVHARAQAIKGKVHVFPILGFRLLVAPWVKSVLARK